MLKMFVISYLSVLYVFNNEKQEQPKHTENKARDNKALIKP